MRERIKKYAGALYIALMTVVVVVVLSCTNELEQIFEAFGQMETRWLLAAGGCIVLYLLLRMATMRYYLTRHGWKISWREAAGVTGAGQFYSAITPSSSGGQPMQVLWLHRQGVPVSLGTACISVKFLSFQASVLLLGGVLGLSKWRMVEAQLYGFRWLVVLGYVVNAGLLVAVALTIPRSNVLDRLSRWAVGIGARLRLVKHPEEVCERFQSAIADYRDALQMLFRRPLDAVVVFLLSMLQVIAYMSVALCLYRAFGLSGAGNSDILTLQLLLFIAAAFVPLPGAAGAQESGFCVFFRGIFPEESLMAAMVCWRFFSYYLLLVGGLVMMAVAGFRRRNRDEAAENKNIS